MCDREVVSLRPLSRISEITKRSTDFGKMLYVGGFTKFCHMNLILIHPPVQWVQAARAPGVKRPGRESNCSPRSSVEVKNAWNYTSTHTIRLHDVVLN
jgi:hypothetical protein